MSKMSKMDSIKDLIHGMIDITPIEKRLIDHRFFQRLRDVSQLSGTNLIFPGAKGDRFSHCLGAMKIAGDYARHLFPEDDSIRQILRISALYHDIAHGPFSHSFDSAVYSKIYAGVEKGHDVQRYKIIQHPEIVEILLQSGITPTEIISIWNKSNKLFHAIVQGPVGADRMDFLMRDALFTGANQFGKLFVDRIIRGSFVRFDDSTNQNVLCYQEKVMDDVTNVLLSRFHMYKSVYIHKTCNASKLLTQLMMEELLSTNNQILAELDVNFEKFTDSYIFHLIQTIGNQKSKDYLKKFQQRILPKMIYEFTVSSEQGDKIFQHFDRINRSKLCDNSSSNEPFFKMMQSDIKFNLTGCVSLDTQINNVSDYILQSNKEIHISKGISLSPLDISSFDNLSIKIIKKDTIFPQLTKTERLINFQDYLTETRFFNGLNLDSGSSIFIRIYSFC